MAKRVTLACRDCKKCTNSSIANLGRNAGRLSAGLMTVGLSEASFLATKKCRQCAHPLSLHSGATHLTPKNKPADDTPDVPAPPPVTTKNNLQEATAGLLDTELSRNRAGIDALPYRLDDEERAILVCVATHSVPGKFLPQSVLVVLTNRLLRVIKSDGSVDEIAFVDIHDTRVLITYKQAFISDSLQLDWPDGSQLRLLVSKNGRSLEPAIAKLRAQPPRSQPVSDPTSTTEPPQPESDAETVSAAPSATSESENDPIALLQRLAELHNLGILTAEEFAAQKARILEHLSTQPLAPKEPRQ